MDMKNPPARKARLAILSTVLLAGSVYATCLCHGGLIVKKFYDANANGVHDAGEPRLAGWVMTLESASKLYSSTKPTDAFGYATFTPLPRPTTIRCAKRRRCNRTGCNPRRAIPAGIRSTRRPACTSLQA